MSDYSQNGLTQGGFPQGGAQDGFTQGGFTQGGFTQGGFPQGGNQGGFPQGGNQDGVPQGGTQGGFTHGGLTPPPATGSFDLGGAPGYPAAPPLPPKRPRSRLVLTVLAGVLALGVVGAGVAYTALQVKDADRTTGTDVFEQPHAKKGGKKAPGSPTELSALGRKLLPMPDNYHLGPDIAEFGNDTVLTSRQAVNLFKAGGRGLPQAQRRANNQAVDKLHLQGIAMRSYALDGARAFSAEIQLAQMENRRAAAGLAAYQSAIRSSLGGFTKGPKIDGYKTAQCFMVPKKSDEVDVMYCTAVQDDLLVTMTAYGGNRTAAANLLRNQLDHVDNPGKAI